MSSSSRRRRINPLDSRKRCSRSAGRFQPWFAALAISQAQRQRQGWNEWAGTAAYAKIDATNYHIPTRALHESGTEIEKIAALPEALRLLLLEDVLSKPVDEPSEMAAMLERGDDKGAAKRRLAELAKHPEHATTFRALLSDPIPALAEDLKKSLSEKKRTFALLDAMRITGDWGLVARFRKEGLLVERVKPRGLEPIPRQPPRLPEPMSLGLPANTTIGRAGSHDVHAAWYYSRNELADSVLVGNGLIARARSGNLLRFDRRTLARTQRISALAITALGAGAGSDVWAGRSDGAVLAVNPIDLTVGEKFKVEGEPLWLATRRDARPGAAPLVLTRIAGTSRRQPPKFQLWNLENNEHHDLHFAGTTQFLDRAGRLWMGSDQGEWGGRLSYIDPWHWPQSGAATTVSEPKLHGIYGVGELPDGTVIAWGGMMHMGATSATIERVEGKGVKTIYSWDRLAEGTQPTEGPQSPITHIVAESPKRLLVFSFDGVFRTDLAFTHFDRASDLAALHYGNGRPDAMGVYPALLAVHPLGGAEGLILATHGDGYLLLSDGVVKARSPQEGSPLNEVQRIVSTRDGVLFIGDERSFPYRLTKDRWEPVQVWPPMPMDSYQRWSEYQVFVELRYRQRFPAYPFA